jgi:2-amino-4-hydroxy-6-hydroxymethyldihydropteridine diphosphokinase
MSRAFIGIASNIDREKNIRSGLDQLSELGAIMAMSGVYENKAVGFIGDNFYNLAIKLGTELPVLELNRLLREIEDRHGRLRDVPRFSDRTLDLDLLIYDELVRHDDELDIPRQDILTYAFVLKPLAEIAAEVKHPESGLKLADIWESFDQSDQELWPVIFDSPM